MVTEILTTVWWRERGEHRLASASVADDGSLWAVRRDATTGTVIRQRLMNALGEPVEGVSDMETMTGLVDGPEAV